jgi:hypothetical protein
MKYLVFYFVLVGFIVGFSTSFLIVIEADNSFETFEKNYKIMVDTCNKVGSVPVSFDYNGKVVCENNATFYGVI